MIEQRIRAVVQMQTQKVSAFLEEVLSEVVGEVVEAALVEDRAARRPTEAPKDITIRQLELLLRAFKAAVKHKKRIGDRFRNHQMSSRTASAAHRAADEELNKAEDAFKAACLGIAQRQLLIRHITEDNDDADSGRSVRDEGRVEDRADPAGEQGGESGRSDEDVQEGTAGSGEAAELQP